VYAHTATDAARFIATDRPRLVVVDMDEPSIGGMDICATAHMTNTSLLVTTGKVENVPAMLKAGCHGVLLKPFSPNLLAARLGRVIKETERPWRVKALPPGWPMGTNRHWADTACPKCGVRGATSFDFSSYRRMWFACLSCDNTWLGPRRE
jgi:DNA-binding response OmpR family regulator